MKVHEVMTREPISVSVDSSLQKVAQIISDYQVDSVPVVDENKQIHGIITKTLLVNGIQKGISFESKVNNIMSIDITPLHENDNAISIFDQPEEKFPVLNHQGQLIGILTKTDVIKVLYERYKKMTTSMQALLESSENGIIAIDPNGRITIFNKMAEQMLQVKATDVIDQELIKAFPNHQLRYLTEADYKQRQKAIELNGMSLVVNRTPILHEERVIGTLAVINDMTAYRNAIQELNAEKDTSDVLKTIMEFAQERIIVVDSNGFITMLSKEYSQFLGVSDKDVIGRHVKDVIENTRMDIVVKTGKAEIAEMQKIKGNYMIASRMPIIKDGKITGAVGKVLFRNVSDLNLLHRRIHNMEREIEHYKVEIKELNKAKYQFENIVGNSLELNQAINFAKKSAMTNSNILLLGESGTGKELFAHAIHNASLRSFGPFVKVNCAAIPADLLESELFGYEEGSFTGAKKGGKMGKFEAANEGTIFLDEIGELPLYMQVKFLRVLQEKEVEKIGSTSSKTVDLRIIAATNRKLEEMVETGEFRTDLYYRLNVITVNIPALRNRADDVTFLSRFLINKLSQQLNKPVNGISDRALQKLKNYSWPGNVRELENVLERAINIIEPNKTITHDQLPEKVTGVQLSNTVHSLNEIIEQAEKKALLDSLRIADGNKTNAAKLLQISRSTLYEKMNKYKIIEN